MHHPQAAQDDDQAPLAGHDITECCAGSSGPETVRLLRSYVDRGDAIYEVLAKPGASPPMHFHKYGETFDIIEGSMTFCLDGKLIEAVKGTCVFVPAGTYHTWINRSDQPVSMRIRKTVDAPFLAVFYDPAARMRDEFCTVAAESGGLVVGPPLVGEGRAPE